MRCRSGFHAWLKRPACERTGHDEKLTVWLRQEAGKSCKQKRTTKQLYAELVALGFDGSYGRVAAFVRYWKTDRIIDRAHHLPGRTVYDWRQYLAVIQRKPGALRNGAPFAELPEAFRQLQGQLLKRNDSFRFKDSTTKPKTRKDKSPAA